MLLRDSKGTDLPAITRIYGHYVENSSASFEMDLPDEAEMARRRQSVLDKELPYLIAEIDGEVAGYAYAAPYRPRRAYRFTLEHSIYLDPCFTGRGVGRALMVELIDQCTRKGYRQMLAVIGGSDNHASIGLHRSLGFEHVGTLPGVGYKFDRWTDSVFMQKSLGPGASTAPCDPATEP